MTLKEFTDLMCTNVEMSIELRDTDNQEICTCKSGSKGIKPYEDYNVNEWFTVPNNGRVVVTISMAHIFAKGIFEDNNLGKIMLCNNKYEDFAKKKAEVKAILEKYKEPADYECDGTNLHYYIVYNPHDKGLLIHKTESGVRYESTTYFKSVSDLVDALKEAGEENVKKYLFGIKE